MCIIVINLAPNYFSVDSMFRVYLQLRLHLKKELYFALNFFNNISLFSYFGEILLFRR